MKQFAVGSAKDVSRILELLNRVFDKQQVLVRRI